MDSWDGGRGDRRRRFRATVESWSRNDLHKVGGDVAEAPVDEGHPPAVGMLEDDGHGGACRQRVLSGILRPVFSQHEGMEEHGKTLHRSVRCSRPDRSIAGGKKEERMLTLPS